MISNGALLLRIIIAIILCGLIGFERQRLHKPVGFSATILIGLGSTIFAILAVSILNEFNPTGSVDIGRFIGQVVTGIGFLGAGALIHDRGSVHGLTAAATIWLAAAVGISVGLGYYFLAIITTIVILITLFILNYIEKFILEKQPNQEKHPDQDKH
jgi:putative Mg2+ transporter-C (MgtC) family protein